MTAVRFDDLETLAKMAAGGWGPWSKAHQVTQEEVSNFGELTNDMQWIHVDPARAAVESPLRSTIAHGFLVLSLLPGLRKSAGPEITGHRSVLNYGIEGLRFLAPVPVGSAIRCRTRVDSATPKKSGTGIDFGVAVHVAEEENPCLILTWKLLYQG